MNQPVLSCQVCGEDAMVAWGRQLSRAAGDDLTIFLHGNLGMGKTTLCRGVLQQAGHVGAVKSPTYTLVEPYDMGSRLVYHFDLYRLADPEELEYLGIRDYFAVPALRLIEWPEKGDGVLPAADVEIGIRLAGEGRQLECRSNTQKGERVVAELAKSAIQR